MKLWKMPYSKKALLLAVGCMLFSIVYEWIITQIAPSNRFLRAFFAVLNCISLSVVSSCVFYIMTDYLPQKHQQCKISERVEGLLLRLSRLGNDTMMLICEKKDIEKDDFLKASEIDLIKDFPQAGRQLCSFSQNISTWFDYFEQMRTLENTLFRGLLIYESNIPIEVKIKIDELMTDVSIINMNDKAKAEYFGYKDKRTLTAYADDLYCHLNSLSNIHCLYKHSLQF